MGEGFPPHPHRGFEIVTYFLAGRRPPTATARATRGVVHAGGLQRITAGRGIWHGEGPGGEPGPMEGLQLWINLPRRDKGIAARATRAWRAPSCRRARWATPR